MRPKLCRPSQEAQRTSPFKTYLPNLTAFKRSSRHGITGFISNDLYKNKCAAQTTYALRRSPTNKSVQNLPPNSDCLRKTADAGSQDLFSMTYLKTDVRPKLCRPSQEAQRTSPFKTYLPNLTPFKDSTDARSHDLFSRISLKNQCAAQSMYALTRSPTNKSV